MFLRRTITFIIVTMKAFPLNMELSTTILGNKAEIESIKRQGQVWAIL
jgi:hypothetical protein